MSDSAVGGPDSDVAKASSEQSAPLQLIRDRESELSRQVLAAKREADGIIADARRQAATIIESATAESSALARQRAQVLDQKAEADAQGVVADAETQASSLSESMQSRLPQAVEYVLKSVIPR